ncbi:MAG: hypothetical protein ACKV22_21195 [Bryobacteraceae bacterium]
MSDLDSLKVDRTVFEVCSLSELTDDREYWRSRTPAERLEALEIMRQIAYGYDPATARLQRVLEVAQLERR